MSLQRSRPIDTLQKVVSSFKHFEKKLDKLQDDVNFQGHTLTELRVMVANLSGGMLNCEGKPIENTKYSANKTTAIHPDSIITSEKLLKTKRKNLIQPFISKIQTASNHGHKCIPKSPKDTPFINKLISSPRAGKRNSRHKKAESPRKTTTLRGQKEIAKKRSKMPQLNLLP